MNSEYNQVETRDSKKESGQHISKLVAIIFFLAIDLGLNSVLDYGSFNDEYLYNQASRLLLGLVGIQIVIEISIFLILFLAMADTFLFRVGLLGVLVKKFRSVIILHPIYVILTLVTGLVRVKYYSDGHKLYYLWQQPTFIALSTVQKIVAVPYYVLNMRACLKLGDPVFFNNTYWINLVRKNRIKS